MKMLSVKKVYEQADIECLMEEHTERMGITRETLNQEVQEGLSLHDLLCNVVVDCINAVRERESAELRRRQREGMTRAQEQGITLGRPSKRSDKRFEKIRSQYERHEVSAEEAAKRLHVSISTFYRWLRQSRKADSSGESIAETFYAASDRLPEESPDTAEETFDNAAEPSDREEDSFGGGF